MNSPSSHRAPIRAIAGTSSPTPRSESLRIFDRMSRSELSLYISTYGLSSLPRLTNHARRVQEAMQFQPSDEPRALAEAVAKFQKEFDRLKRAENKANWPQLQMVSGGPIRTAESHPCQCCGGMFKPLKSQVRRGNGIWCGKSECRVAARKARAA